MKLIYSGLYIIGLWNEKHLPLSTISESRFWRAISMQNWLTNEKEITTWILFAGNLPCEKFSNYLSFVLR
jgi:hypothetical protein